MGTAVITGGGRGIGRAAALALGAAGYQIVVISRTESELRDVAATAEARGLRCHAIVADVAEPHSAASAIHDAHERCGDIQVLVNCAGAHPRAVAIDDYPLDYWNELLAVNLSAAFYTSRTAVPFMKAVQSGRIINVSSVAGKTGFPNAAGYVAAKHGVIGLTKALAAELGPHGITVNAVCPGFVDTRMTVHKSELRNWAIEHSAIRRVVSVDEVASLIAYLALPDAAAITGQALSVCGGLQM